MPSEDNESWRRIAPEERARQFMPFAALQGYYELIEEAAYVPEPRRPITEERSRKLSETAAQIKHRGIMQATYYNGTAYQTLTGAVTQISCDLRTIRILKTTINFNDLWELKILKQ